MLKANWQYSGSILSVYWHFCGKGVSYPSDNMTQQFVGRFELFVSI